MTRVECLYRVSTKGQVDHDDIPMQRIECRKFAEQQGWNIIKELCEKGVSGFKISADDRDAIQELREDAMTNALTYCSCLCSTALAGAMTKRRSWSSGSPSRASAFSA